MGASKQHPTFSDATATSAIRDSICPFRFEKNARRPRLFPLLLSQITRKHDNIAHPFRQTTPSGYA